MSLQTRVGEGITVRCECRICGCHLVGSLTLHGVRGRCGICAGEAVELVRGPGPGRPLAGLGLLAEAPLPEGFSQL